MLEAILTHMLAVTEIPTWAAVHAYLVQSARTPSEIRAESFRFRFFFKGALVPFKAAAVTSANQRPWLSLSINVCALKRLRLRPALMTTLAFPVGALAVAQDEVMVVQTLPLSGLLAHQLEITMRALARLAGQLQQAASVPTVPTVPTVSDDDVENVPYAYLFR